MKAQPNAIHLLAGGPGSDSGHLVRLLASALHATGAAGTPVAYVGAASGDDAGFQQRITRLLAAAGNGNVRLAPSARGLRDAPAARRVLDQAGAVFMSGGDVEEGMRNLRAAGVVTLLQQALARGAAFIGLSAGSIMLGRAWLAWGDPDDDATARPFDCLGFAPFVCDTHAEADGWSELHTLLAHLPEGLRGYAIPAPAMLRVNAGGGVEALGGDIPVYTRRGGKILEDNLKAQ
jgi:peptidase E